MVEKNLYEKLGFTFASISIFLYLFAKSNPAPENYAALLVFAALTGIFSSLNYITTKKIFWAIPAFESIFIIILSLSKLW